MRKLLIITALGLGLTACETHNDTYNCSCKCDMGCNASPSDTTCVKPDASSVNMETEEIMEGGQ